MPHVKLFYEEKEANIVICALLSGSLLFENKKETLLEIIATLGLDTLQQGNALTPIMISHDRHFSLPTSKNPHALKHFLQKLNAIPLQGKQNALNSLSKTLHKLVKKKSLVLLVGDFLGEVDLRILAQRHALFVLIVRDSFEENPKILGDGEFSDPESGESADFYFGKSAQKAYAKAYHDNDEKLFKHLHTLGIAYTKVVR